MRFLIDGLIVLMLASLAGAFFIHRYWQRQSIHEHDVVRAALTTLHGKVHYHSALGDTQEKYPKEIQPQWFDGDDRPRNVLVAPGQPWLDYAAPEEASEHPADPIITSPDQGGFWYNPSRGIFRARVPAQISQNEALRLYNAVNQTNLLALPELAFDQTKDDAEPQPSRVTLVRPAPQADAKPAAVAKNVPPKHRKTLLSRHKAGKDGAPEADRGASAVH